MADYINVTSLNRLARQVLAQCDPLNDLIVCGEISGFTRHYKSGHLYFTLKDENASIKTVMFRSQAQLLNFEPQNGMLVLVYGRATIYERDGAFQLYADYMKPFGAGAAQMAFDALYKKLEAEGLFAPERKRPLPAVPRCIGVVTSKTGAAWQDVQNVIRRRWPMVKLLLAPVSVQGIEAEKSITEGIRRLDRGPHIQLPRQHHDIRKLCVELHRLVIGNITLRADVHFHPYRPGIQNSSNIRSYNCRHPGILRTLDHLVHLLKFVIIYNRIHREISLHLSGITTFHDIPQIIQREISR